MDFLASNKSYPYIQFCVEEITNGILVFFKKLHKATTTLAATELTEGVSGEVMKLLSMRDGEKSRNELQKILGLKHEIHFRAF